MVTWDEFEGAAKPLRAALEERRRRFLRYHRLGLLAALVLVVSAAFFPLSVLHGLQLPFHMQTAIKPSDMLAYRLFALLCAAFLALGPVFSYRGSYGVSVEQAVVPRLLNPWGDSVFMRRGGLQQAEVRRAADLPDNLLFHSGEGLSADFGGIRLRLCEAALFKRGNAGDVPVFAGLIIMADRAPVMRPGFIPSPPDAPVPVLDIASLETLSRGAPEHWDERVVYAVEGIRARLRERFFSRRGNKELPAEKAYRLKYQLPHPIQRPAASPHEALYPQAVVVRSGRSGIILVPGLRRIFTLGSLFHEVLPERQMAALYALMQAARALAADQSARTDG